MTNEERIATIQNVISDLQAILKDVEHKGGEMDNGNWKDAQLSAEYITENTPQL